MTTKEDLKSVSIRRLPAAVLRNAKRAAERNATSAEAEMRQAIIDKFTPKKQKGVGTLLYELGRKYGPLEPVERDKTPTEPADFS